MNETLRTEAERVREPVIAWRRHLHADPELSFAEHRTSAWVQARLEETGGLEITRPTPTSVMAVLRGALPGPVLALRADIDALPIQEETGLPYASRNDGVMHACGHDGHTAILLGVAHVLTRLREELRGEVRFLFQHAEESVPGGARELVAAGVMEGVDRVLGLHLFATLESGTAIVRTGRLLAACDVFTIEINGRGGHIGQPDESVDALLVGAQVVTALQQIVTNNVNPREPAVLLVTTLQAGDNNIGVISHRAVLRGGTHCFSPQVQDLLERRITEVVDGVCAAAGAEGHVRYQRGYAAVVNDADVTEVVRRTAADVVGGAHVLDGPAMLVSEDFSAYQQVAPGCFVMLGAAPQGTDPPFTHHHPRFDIAESALHDGVLLMAASAFALQGAALDASPPVTVAPG